VAGDAVVDRLIVAADLLRELHAAVERGDPVVMATVVETRRSVPRHAGAKMLVFGDGRMVGTVGGGAMESQVIDEARAALRTGRPKLVNYELIAPDRGDPGVCGGEVRIYLEPYMPPATVFIVGAGHVGRAVAELAHWLGYRVVITDDRPDQADAEALPDADVVHAGPLAAALEAYPVDDRTAVVVVSRDTQIDVDAVTRLMDSPARYVGVMGSERRWRIVRDQLVEAGIDADGLADRVHVPIGIDLGAETVEEIAVAIMGEIIREARMESDPNV
jgi:xanthine dehydrogenase accessory factor